MKTQFKTSNDPLLDINEKLKNETLSLPQLEILNKKLLEKYLQFFYSKSAIDQIKDICRKKTLNKKIMLDIVKLAIQMKHDEVFPVDPESKKKNNYLQKFFRAKIFLKIFS